MKDLEIPDELGDMISESIDAHNPDHDVAFLTVVAAHNQPIQTVSNMSAMMQLGVLELLLESMREKLMGEAEVLFVPPKSQQN